MVDETEIDKMIEYIDKGAPTKTRKRNGGEEIPIAQKYALTIPEAAKYFNIGQNKIGELLAKPRCPFALYVGKKRLVKREEFEQYLNSCLEV